MKNKKTNVLKRRSLLAIIALVAVIWFSMTACDPLEEEKEEEETISLQGKWDAGGNNYYEFTGENFRVHFTDSGSARGTFTYTTTHITFNPTQYWTYIISENKYDWVDWYPTGQFDFHGIRGTPVTYRFEKLKTGVYLYINGGNLGYKKQ